MKKIVIALVFLSLLFLFGCSNNQTSEVTFASAHGDQSGDVVEKLTAKTPSEEVFSEEQPVRKKQSTLDNKSEIYHGANDAKAETAKVQPDTKEQSPVNKTIDVTPAKSTSSGYITKTDALKLVSDSFGEDSVKNEIPSDDIATNLYLRGVLERIPLCTIVEYYSTEEFPLTVEQAQWMVDAAMLYSQFSNSDLSENDDEYVTEAKVIEMFRKNFPDQQIPYNGSDEPATIAFVSRLLFDCNLSIYGWITPASQAKTGITEKEVQFMFDYAKLMKKCPSF